jgi:hypothetical protein
MDALYYPQEDYSLSVTDPQQLRRLLIVISLCWDLLRNLHASFLSSKVCQFISSCIFITIRDKQNCAGLLLDGSQCLRLLLQSPRLRLWYLITVVLNTLLSSQHLLWWLSHWFSWCCLSACSPLLSIDFASFLHFILKADSVPGCFSSSWSSHNIIHRGW